MLGWFVYDHVAHGDAHRSAQNVADMTGRPQVLILLYEGGETELVEPNPVKRRALGVG